jgi:large subunit ribosomal protein L9
MRVILLQDVKKVGKKGETVVVSDGYGTNFLIPKGLAKASTNESQKELAKNNAEETARQKELKAEAEKVKARLESLNVEFTAKVGKDGRMFGSISPKEIEEAMLKQWGIQIDKRKFLDKEPANSIGYTRLRIELYHGSEGVVVGTVNVHISEAK